MLEDLTIKNFALLDSVYIEFSKGFTVLSGETGAGKSILIGALSFLLGGKAGVEQIRSGASEASVTGTFLLPPVNNLDKLGIKKNPEGEMEARTARQWLGIHSIESEDDRIIIRRYIRDNGKSAAWIGSTPVTRADLQSFCFFLVDIHGQHEHQSLMDEKKHLAFLDATGDEKHDALLQGAKEAFLLWSEKKKQLVQLKKQSAQAQERMELLQLRVQELKEANLTAGEEDALMKEREV
uniref:AAA family ATPase n=1 Tax=Treponema sp. TaxID=166 RepID=UPI00388E81C9